MTKPVMTRAQWMEATGNWLREQRQACGLTQAQLARETRLAQSSICGWEQAKHAMDSFSRQRLSEFFRLRRTGGKMPPPSVAKMSSQGATR